MYLRKSPALKMTASKNGSRQLLLVAALFLAACSPAAQTSKRFTFPWLQTVDWNGKAEIAVYRGQVRRYGQFREARLDLITVTEPWNLRQMVKSESGQTADYALKQNQVITFQTGVYPYRQMNSMFWNLASGQLWKAVMSSQEWCGTSFKELRTVGDGFDFQFSSYWEDESIGHRHVHRPLPAESPAAILFDELPLLVRTPEFADLADLQVFPLLMSSQVDRPDFDIGEPRREPAFAAARVEQRQVSLRIGSRNFPRVIRYEVRSAGPAGERVDRFYVDQESVNRTLLRWERHDGGEFTLSELYYAPYWQMHAVGDHFSGNRL
ncbi:MAG: hypothetical protein K1X75_13600 [Leptospirales bacterium]|nr:hypothetical protein [Leptospirales bacterium]